MRWSDCAIQDLKKYDGLKSSLDNIADRIEALEEKFTGIRGAATDKVPVSGGGSHWEDFLLDNIVERERLKLTYNANKKLVAVTERGLAALNNTERKVLNRFFMNRPRDHIRVLCEELHLEQAQIYRIKDQALYKFTVYMYGIEEY
jgi:hypothetical protein